MLSFSLSLVIVAIMMLSTITLFRSLITEKEEEEFGLIIYSTEVKTKFIGVRQK